MRACQNTKIVDYFRIGDQIPDWFTSATINKFAKFVPQNKEFWEEEILQKGTISPQNKYFISTLFGIQEVPHGHVIIQTQQETFLSFCSYEHFCDKFTKLAPEMV